MIIVMIVAMLATVVSTGPGDYIPNPNKPEHVYEPPGSIRR